MEEEVPQCQSCGGVLMHQYEKTILCCTDCVQQSQLRGARPSGLPRPGYRWQEGQTHA